MQMNPIGYLTSHQVGSTSAAGRGAIAALSDPSGAPVPVRGVYLAELDRSADSPHLVLFAVTGARLVRYEWQPDAELVTSVALRRVTTIDRLTRGSETTVTIGVDSHVTVYTGQYREQTVEDRSNGEGAALTGGETQVRGESLVYRLHAADEPRSAELAAFSAAVAAAVEALAG